MTLDLIGCWDRSQIEFISILLECHFKLVFILNIMKKDIFINIYKIKKWSIVQLVQQTRSSRKCTELEALIQIGTTVMRPIHSQISLTSVSTATTLSLGASLTG